jgi:hypothetical protein
VTVSLSCSFENKMSNTEAEKMLLGLLKIYHENITESDTIDKSGLSKMMKENFPTFLSACVSGDVMGLGKSGAGMNSSSGPICLSMPAQ